MTQWVRQGRHVIANGVRLHYVRFGSGRAPLVLLPGITSPAATWEFVAERLSAFNDVYVMDIRGRGLSQGGPDLGYWLDDYAADTVAFIGALGLQAPAILGHSMGARIAVRVAARCPEVVGRLVLADPPVSGPGRRPYPIPLEFYLNSLDAVERGTGYEQMRKGLPWTDEQLETRMEWLPTCDRTAIIQSHRSFHEEEIHRDLPGIQAPTLLLYAELGGTVSDADADEIAGAIPNCRKERVDGAGHMIPWDRLDVFVDRVARFLSQ